MNITIPKVDALLTSNGTVQGYVQVQDNTPFYPGAICNLYSGGGVASVQIIITDVLADGQSIGCRIVPLSPATGTSLGTGPSYGRSDVSAFLTANGARINQPRQDVAIEPSFAKRPLL